MNAREKQDRASTGYGSPPLATRFRKGQSGNPRGRPPGRSRSLPYDAVLGQMVTVREGETERRVTAAEAFLLQITRKGLEGDSAAARAAMVAIEEARALRLDRDDDEPLIIVRVAVAPGSVNSALEPLRMASKQDRYRETARMALEPWIVEAAIARLGSNRLTLDEQRIVVQATRTPHKVRWPEWWKVR